MLYNGLNIGVVYKNKSWMVMWFDEFLKTQNKEYVKKFSKIYGKYKILMKDGTTITAIRDTKLDGEKFDKVFVEPSVSLDAVRFSGILSPGYVVEYELI